MKIEDGWLSDVRRCESPNFHVLADREISLLVVHNISLPAGEFGGPFIDQLFTNRLNPNVHADFAPICDLRVSSHLLIRRDGEIVQYVPFDKCAHQAGVSSFQGRDRCNDFSLGIELEGTDFSGFSDMQYAQLVQVTRLLLKTFPEITRERIVGHSGIAPGRKTDPGPSFDWARFKSQI